MRFQQHGPAPPSLAPIPRRQKNPWAPLEVLTPEALENLMDAAYRILEEGGLEFRSDRARDVFRVVVESYLGTGMPVGSRTISTVGGCNLSPASSRNVMTVR